MSRTEEVELTNMCMICDGKGNVLVQDKKNHPSWHGWNFPGCHVEKGEYATPSVIREIKEETGVDIPYQQRKPFFSIIYLNKDYPNKGDNTKYISC